MSALVNALRQTEKYGTPLAASLRILAQEFRQTRAIRPRERRAHAGTYDSATHGFHLPTLITVLLAPAIMAAFSMN